MTRLFIFILGRSLYICGMRNELLYNTIRCNKKRLAKQLEVVPTVKI